MSVTPETIRGKFVLGQVVRNVLNAVVLTVPVLTLACMVPTIVVTIVRLVERTRRKKLGYDDAFAALSLSGLVMQMTALFFFTSESMGIVVNKLACAHCFD